MRFTWEQWISIMSPFLGEKKKKKVSTAPVQIFNHATFFPLGLYVCEGEREKNYHGKIIEKKT